MAAPTKDLEQTFLSRDGVVAGLLVGIVTLGVIVAWQRYELRRLENEKTTPESRAAITVRSAQSRSLFVGPPQTTSSARDGLPKADAGDPMAVTGAARTDKTRPQRVSPLARLLENPEFFQLLDRHRQATLDTRFAGLFRRLALGADELATFKQLLAEKDNVALEVVAVSETQPDGPLPATVLTASVAAARSKVEEAIRASLGGDRYAVYREFEETRPQRAVVAQLEQRLSYSGAPLTPAQSDALVRVLAAHAPAPAVDDSRAASPVVVGPGSPAALERLQSDTAAASVSDAALADSRSVLSAPQLASLREIQAEQQASLQALRLIRENLPINDPNTPAALRALLQ